MSKRSKQRNTTGRREYAGGTYLWGWGNERRMLRRMERAQQSRMDVERIEESREAVTPSPEPAELPYRAHHEHRWAFVRRDVDGVLSAGQYECIRRGCTEVIEEVEP